MQICFGKCFDVATFGNQSCRLHLVCVTGLLFLTSLVQVTIFAQDCPAEPSNCTCISSADLPGTKIQCLNLGSLNQFFHFRNDTRIILLLNVTGLTTISRIQDGAFGELKIREIRLSKLVINTIDSAAFNGSGLSEYLQILYLDQNQLVSLSGTVFARLHNLLQLRLNLNRLKVIAPRTFNELTALNVLDFSSNEIVSLANGTFANLTKLQDLKLASNRITVIQDRLFEPLENLINLDLSYNAIASIPENAFRNMTLLKSLDISSNNLSSIAANCFQYNVELKLLQASGNRLEYIDRLFYRTTKLDTLVLSSNTLKSIKSLPFENTALMTTLQLDYNLLENLEANQFAGLVTLKYLYLQYNAISVVNSQTFAALYSVIELDISGNRLQTIPETFFDYLQSLLRLNVRENRISSMGQKPFDYLAKLVELDFSWNELPNIWESMFAKLVKLEKLWLQANRIAKIDGWSFLNLTNLVYLDLSQNWITEIPESLFVRTGKLEVLRLAHNPLSVLKGNSLYGLFALKELYLNNTCLTSLDESYFFSLQALEVLHMQGNAISRLTRNSFTGLTGVKLLNMSYNNMSSLEYSAFTQMTSLKKVIMAHNSLNTSMVATMIGYLPYSVSSLDLDWNDITSLQGTDSHRLNGLMELYLSGNPLICNCSLLSLSALKDIEKMSCTGSTSLNQTNYTTVLCYAQTSRCSAYQTRNVTDDICRMPLPPLEYNMTRTSDYDPGVCDPDRYRSVTTKSSTTTTTANTLSTVELSTTWYQDFNVSYDNFTAIAQTWHSDAYIYAVVITTVLSVLLALTVVFMFTIYVVSKKRKQASALRAKAAANQRIPSAYTVYDDEDDALDWPGAGNVEGGVEQVVDVSVLWMSTETPENDDN